MSVRVKARVTPLYERPDAVQFLQEQIKLEHIRAEAQRRTLGYESCGCSLCLRAYSQGNEQQLTEAPFLATTVLGGLHSCQKSEVVSYASTPFVLSKPPLKQALETRGRPRRTDVPLAEVKRLRDQGLGCKRISRALEAQGIAVSFRTVHRLMKEIAGIG